MSKYTSKEKESIIQKYKSGQTISLISKESGIARGTIYSWLKENLNQVNIHTFNLLKQKCERITKMVEILKTSPCTLNSNTKQ
jgi:transposase-like protein